MFGRLIFPKRLLTFRQLQIVKLKRGISSEIQRTDAQSGESTNAVNTGVIQKTDEETLMYFDNVYPRATSLWRPTQWYNFLLTNQSREAVREKIMKLASPPNNPITGLELRATIATQRDGGVFATFLVPPEYTKAEVNAKIQQNTERESSKSIISFFTKVAAFPVKGAPWYEDLRRLPSNTIRIEFEDKALTEEELYSLFRRYGTIIDIYPPTAKDPTATIRYRSFRGAICAKNCVSGLEVNNTVLHVKYEPIIRGHVIRDFFVNHPRIAIPLIFAFLSIAAVLIFEPVREFSIEQKISHTYTLSKDNYFVQKILSFTSSTMSSVKHLWGVNEAEPEQRQLWQERRELVSDLKLWLEENNNTFVIVTGPRGSGKHELLMKHTLHERSNVLYLDCDSLVKSRTDSKFLRTAAHQIGYFPIFPWLNSFTGLIDLTVQGLTGQKSGLSESKETQFRSMLNTAMMSIRRIALKGYKADVESGHGQSTIKEEDYLQQHPDKKPVIVIDRFTNKAEMNGFVYKELAEWASILVQMNIAHVIFLTESVTPNQLLAEALPNQVFKFMTLSDATKESARSYVLSHLQDNFPPPKNDDISYHPKLYVEDIDRALEPIGGRMLDLQAFVRRVKSGESPSEALDKMVEQASEQITQMFLSEKSDTTKTAQAWELITMLAEHDSINFKDVFFKPLFKSSPEAGLLELEKNGLITVTRNRGVLNEIRPAKPLFKAAFAFLTRDQQLSTVLKTGYLLRLINFETNRIKKWEEELRMLGNVTDQKLFRSRLTYLASKIEASNAIVKDCEDQAKRIASGS
ncbi:HFR133Wp [Eremothecium sinecaudum]|uniref:Mitochondrial escape protein 2 n=1 Tax=Eremothecium sinecaudum TaxID=45286 RepID=A0A109UZW7_9SACH|nr:HFR133Wp [Eremothecium sinecaudum]AMD21988.1 HFR133Wp [Eremothecium sinecaudum]